jgi:TatD DNase family protein
MFIDSHCHLDRLKLSYYNDSLEAALDAARDAGVHRMLCVSIDLEHLDAVLDIAAQHQDIYASVGVHPTSYEGREPDVETLLKLAQHEKVIAIGETGLDCYYGGEHLSLQQSRFIVHMEAAKRCRKPVIVHSRDAKELTLAMIREHSDPSIGGVLHCFTEDLDMALRAIEMNFYISFSGIVTFKNAIELQHVARAMPLERMLIETDSPYLAPVPYRGKSNEPKFVPEVAKFIAQLRGESVEHIAQVTSANFNRLFGLSD